MPPFLLLTALLFLSPTIHAQQPLPMVEQLVAPFTEPELGGIGCLVATTTTGGVLTYLMGGIGRVVASLQGPLPAPRVLEGAAAATTWHKIRESSPCCNAWPWRGVSLPLFVRHPRHWQRPDYSPENGRRPIRVFWNHYHCPIPSPPLEESVVQDGQVITSRGPGTALDFALTLVEVLAGAATRKQVASDLLYPEA